MPSAISLRGSKYAYGGAAKTFHWVTAFLIVATIPIAFSMQAVADPDTKLLLYRAHAWIGGVVIAVTVVRLIWLFFDRRPAPAPEMIPGERIANSVAFSAFYVLLFILAGSGVAMVLVADVSSGLARGVAANLGLSDILFGTGPEYALTETAKTGIPRLIHGAAARFFAVLLLFHGAVALWHRIVRRDTFLARMLPRPWEPHR